MSTSTPQSDLALLDTENARILWYAVIVGSRVDAKLHVLLQLWIIWCSLLLSRIQYLAVYIACAVFILLCPVAFQRSSLIHISSLESAATFPTPPSPKSTCCTATAARNASRRSIPCLSAGATVARIAAIVICRLQTARTKPECYRYLSGRVQVKGIILLTLNPTDSGSKKPV